MNDFPYSYDAAECGWLDRDGRFYGGPDKHHMLVLEALDVDPIRVEQMGWVKIWHKPEACGRYNTPRTAWSHYGRHRLSADQRNWLLLNGFHVSEFD